MSCHLTSKVATTMTKDQLVAAVKAERARKRLKRCPPGEHFFDPCLTQAGTEECVWCGEKRDAAQVGRPRKRRA